MIRGFEEETADLTREEKEIKKAMIKGLKLRTSKKNAVTSGEMSEGLTKYGEENGKEHFIDVSGARIRKIINNIRLKGELPLLLASSKGYWVSEDPEEIKDYLAGLKDRIGSIQAMHDSLEMQLEQSSLETQ